MTVAAGAGRRLRVGESGLEFFCRPIIPFIESQEILIGVGSGSSGQMCEDKQSRPNPPRTTVHRLLKPPFHPAVLNLNTHTLSHTHNTQKDNWPQASPPFKPGEFNFITAQQLHTCVRTFSIHCCDRRQLGKHSEASAVHSVFSLQKQKRFRARLCLSSALSVDNKAEAEASIVTKAHGGISLTINVKESLMGREIMRKKNFWQTPKKGKLPQIALYSMFSSLTHGSLIFPSPWCLYHGLMTCLRTPKVTLCSSNMWKLLSASFTIIHNVCGSGYTLSSHVWVSVSAYVCVWESVWEKEAKSVSVLSVCRCLSLSSLRSDQSQRSLSVRCG